MARGRGTLLLLTVIFFGPLAVAAWLYYGGMLTPDAGTNAGWLLEPLVNVDEALGEESLAGLTAGASEGKWVLLYRNPGACGADCEAALYRLRQSRLMLGRDMTRLVRVFLHGETAPDTVLIETEHDGLITITNSELGNLLDRKKPADLAPGGLYLIDPLGNLVMYFTAELPPEDMVEDIEHLLDLSRIG